MLKTCGLLISLGMMGLVLSYETPQWFSSYHDEVGIPLAEIIYNAEKEMKEKGIIGHSYVNTRIVNGTNSSVGDHPYLGGLVVFLADGNMSVCGSSLLSETRSLTAGHCWNDGTYDAEKLELVHGVETLFFGGVRTESRDVVVHENFNYTILRNDVAMIKHPKIAFTDKIQPVALPDGNFKTNKFTNMKATALGYGMTSSNESGKIVWGQKRNEVTVTVIANSVCRRHFWRAVTTKTICTAGVENGGIGICQGDSGGPLTINDNNTRILIGVTSFSMKVCQDPPYYSGFSRVTEILPWILDKIK